MTVDKMTKLKRLRVASISGGATAYLSFSIHGFFLPVFSLPSRVATGDLKSKNMATVLADSDSLYEETQYQKVYDLLVPLKNDSDDEVLWRLARATFELAKQAPRDDEKKVKNMEAYEYIQKALTLNDNNFAVHKWMAIIVDVVSNYEGTKVKIIKSELIKHHITRATELNPKDATSYYILGVWCYSVADLPWYQRQIASAVFATPPTSSFEEAMVAFQKAEQIDPKFYSMNLLMLAKCHLKVGKKEDAIDILRQLSGIPMLTEDDKRARKEATDLLKSLNVTF